MRDLISRETALKAIEEICFALWEIDIPSPTVPEYAEHHEQVQRVMALAEKWGKELRDAPDVQPQRWIPFETREPDAEEKEDHPEWEYVLCGNLPDDGQRILVNIKYKGHEAVQMDEYVDDGGICYLDSGYDIGTEATAWMPLPKPYKGETE